MENSTELVTKAQSTAHRRIFEGLRRQIVEGRFATGSQLPSTKELAITWQSSPFTIHTALTALAKEGWIDRRHGSGTYIADPKTRFLCAGIYHSTDIGSIRQTAFNRNVHFSLLSQLERMKKGVQIFTDSRPEHLQEAILPELAEAIFERRIQCIIAPTINGNNERALAELTLPTAFIVNQHSPNTACFEASQFFREGAERLLAQGCRSVGLISNIWLAPDDHGPYAKYYNQFHEAISAAGLISKEEWIRRPTQFEPDMEVYGYHAFKSLMSSGEKPDGLIATPDTVVRGVILAVLELGLHLHPEEMKFIFHRNAHFKFLCPFPVTWGISDEDILAEGLVRQVQRQFNGEKISPLLLPFIFTQGEEL